MTTDDYMSEYQLLAAQDLKTPFDKHKHKLCHLPLVRFIGDVREKTVLDIGCASGEILSMLDAKYKTGCDIAQSYLERAQATGLKVFKHDAELPFPKIGQFDVIILSSIIEHVQSPERVIKNLSSLTHKDTRIIVLVPYQEDISVYKQAGYKYAHLRSLDLYSLNKIFKDYRLNQYKCITPKNPFQERRGAYILLRKMFSAIVLYMPKRLVDRILVTDMRMQASSLLAEYRIKEQPPQAAETK
jgi:SAM-dependent methyltransferase